MTLDELIEQLSLERLEQNIYRGASRHLGGRSVYGGQVLGQALMAAGRTVPAEWSVHSLHAYFLRAGDTDASIIYKVERIRDGKSFATRRVAATQHGRPIFHMSSSFQVREDGVEHQIEILRVPFPEDISAIDPTKAENEPKKQNMGTENELKPIDVKFVNPVDPYKPKPQLPHRHIWFKASGQLPDDPHLHRTFLAYVSDLYVLGTALLPHGLSFRQRNLQGASIDHAMWFHRDFRADDWLLYQLDSPFTGGARGLGRGNIFSRDGQLVATVIQEGLIRLHPEEALE